jgi:hypothetical protein
MLLFGTVIAPRGALFELPHDRVVDITDHDVAVVDEPIPAPYRRWRCANARMRSRRLGSGSGRGRRSAVALTCTTCNARRSLSVRVTFARTTSRRAGAAALWQHFTA